MSRDERAAYRREHLGEFIAVPIQQGFAFARFRGGIDFAFYDICSAELLPIDQIKHQPVLFTLGCSADSLAKGAWKVIGQEPLEPDLAAPPKYVRNPAGSDYVDIYCGGEFRPYAGEDLTKLEPCAVWDTPEQVEERLRLHFAGQPYPWSERVKVPRELAERLYREYWAKHGGAPKG